MCERRAAASVRMRRCGTVTTSPDIHGSWHAAVLVSHDPSPWIALIGKLIEQWRRFHASASDDRARGQALARTEHSFFRGRRLKAGVEMHLKPEPHHTLFSIAHQARMSAP